MSSRSSSSLIVGALLVSALFACGQTKPRPIEEEDAGVDAGVDAGRPRGEDPATGWRQVFAYPDGGMATTKLGPHVSSAPDQFNQPLVAAVYVDPSGDGDFGDNRVVFTRWNGTDKKFQDLKTVEVVGDVLPTPGSKPSRQVSVAYDATVNRVAVAYVKQPGEVRLAHSADDGAFFSLSTVSTGSGVTSNPVLALRGDVTHLVYLQDGQLIYRKRTGLMGTFMNETAPTPAGLTKVVDVPPALVLDGNGNPGVAYFVADPMPMSFTASLVFWRPGTTTATVIASSGSTEVLQPALLMPGVALTYVGQLPRVAFHLRNTPRMSAMDNTSELFFAAASDAAGTMWGTPVALPRNGNGMTFNSTRWYSGLSVDATGKVVVAGYFSEGGFTGGQCGGPKLGRSNDGASFTVCAPGDTPYNFAGEWLTLWPHTMGGKVTLIFATDGARTLGNGTVLDPGVVMWREP